MSKTINEIAQLMDEIKNLVNLEFDDLQKFEDMKALPMHQNLEIEGTINKMIVKEPNHLRFLTTIPPGESFKMHWHDCLEECTILSGELRDRLQPEKSWKSGEVWRCDKFKKHIPYNDSKTDEVNLIVDFYL